MRAPEQILQDNIENECAHANNMIEAALWHWSRSPDIAVSEVEAAIEALQAALKLMVHKGS